MCRANRYSSWYHVQHVIDLAAGGCFLVVRCLQAAIAAKCLCLRIVSDVTGLDDYHVLAMIRMQAMPARCNNAAHAAMVEREGVKMLGNENNREPLIFTRAKGARGYDVAGLETQ